MSMYPHFTVFNSKENIFYEGLYNVLQYLQC